MPDFPIPSDLQKVKRKITEIEKRLEAAEKVTKRLRIEGKRVFVKVET